MGPIKQGPDIDRSAGSSIRVCGETVSETSHSFGYHSSLYRELILEREEILRHKWIESEKVGIDMEKVFVNVESYGNMASACLPIALDQARKTGRLNPGDTALLVAFGSGFVWASALVKM